MSFESAEVVVTGTGHVYVAPVGTDFPDDISQAVSQAAGWRELGYVSEEGARFAFNRDVNEIMAWQSFDPIRLVVTRVPKEISFDLMQWNQFTVALALGGGTVTTTGAGEYEYNPPDESFVDERALIVEGTDGDRNYRFCFRKSINMQGVDFAFVRSDPANLPVTMKVLAADDDATPYFLQTDDDNIGLLAEAGS